MRLKAFLALSLCCAIASGKEIRVETDLAVYVGLLLQGDGSDNDTTRGFFGVPYAQPPTGQLRFAPPLPWQPPRSNEPGAKPELMANASKPRCLQLAAAGSSLRMSEDCLYLNIQTPVPHQADSSRPVIAWLHSGFLETGGISEPEAPLGRQLVARQRLLLVEVAFRLGVLGFLRPPGTTGGNWGLLDQQMALSWISSNIRAFGGDAGSVTLAGASYGASATGLHLFSAGSSRLFHRTALLGGSPLAPWLLVTDDAAASAIADDFTARASCRRANDSETLRCLRDAGADALTALQPPADRPLDVAAFPVVIDGRFITDRPAPGSLATPKPVVLGVAESDSDSLAVRAIGHRNVSGLAGQLYQDVLDEAFRFFPSFPRRPSATGRRLLSGRLTAFPSASAARLNKQLLARGLGLWHSACPVNQLSDWLCGASAPVFVYQFAEAPRPGGDSTDGLGEDAAYFAGEPLGDQRYDRAQRELSSLMTAALAEFCHDGRISSLNWPAVSLAELQFLRLSSTTGQELSIGGLNRQDCQFWQDELPWVNSLDTGADGGTTAQTSRPPDLESEFWARCNSTVNTISLVALSVAGGLLLLLCLSMCFACRRRPRRPLQVDNLRRGEAGSNTELPSRTAGGRILDVTRPGRRPDGRFQAVEGTAASSQRTTPDGSRPGLRPKRK
ncbi:hypothetical protein BOX15_Mlig032086g1 [Macrostomum lignano]|uniref:Carboxylesterase type B domain-containing protein n=1 Tax=Macrostomum lignano TaxID=282301 RepID=A0A267EEQ1_9PLAT|nr:hypothetical protein BOX15_Mlig032086g1 [Macrostomum lignano]